MEALQQLTQRQCRHLTIQDLTEMFDTEAVYTKSILHVLETKNLIQMELHYSCPECHSQNVFVRDGFQRRYQCYQCQNVFESSEVEKEGIPFYSISKDNFIQYVKEEYPDMVNQTIQREKEIIPFRPSIVEKKEESPVFSPKEEPVQQEKHGTDLEERIKYLEKDRNGKKLDASILKIVILVIVMTGATAFVVWEMINIFIIKAKNPLIYQIYQWAVQGSVAETEDMSNRFIDFVCIAVSGVVMGFDGWGIKKIYAICNSMKNEYIK